MVRSGLIHGGRRREVGVAGAAAAGTLPAMPRPETSPSVKDHRAG
jgi:hypothetical protein